MKIDRKEVANLLTKKGAMNACHRCKHGEFTILEGFTNLMIQEDLSPGVLIGGPTLPVVHVVCNNCGAITSHAVGALGLLPENEEGKANEL